MPGYQVQDFSMRWPFDVRSVPRGEAPKELEVGIEQYSVPLPVRGPTVHTISNFKGYKQWNLQWQIHLDLLSGQHIPCPWPSLLTQIFVSNLHEGRSTTSNTDDGAQLLAPVNSMPPFPFSGSGIQKPLSISSHTMSVRLRSQ